MAIATPISLGLSIRPFLCSPPNLGVVPSAIYFHYGVSISQAWPAWRPPWRKNLHEGCRPRKLPPEGVAGRTAAERIFIIKKDNQEDQFMVVLLYIYIYIYMLQTSTCLFTVCKFKSYEQECETENDGQPSCKVLLRLVGSHFSRNMIYFLII